jgi:hypothetical protein
MAANALAEMTFEKLMAQSSYYRANDVHVAEARAEPKRRHMNMAIKASRAQIRSACQLVAVISMFLTMARSTYIQLWLAAQGGD